LPEVGGESVVYCTPQEPISIATAIYEIISEESFKDGIIKKGYGNAEKFSWEKCAKQISEVLVG
jgi:glycosyltransferase involved in cell wall biosynthesis